MRKCFSMRMCCCAVAAAAGPAILLVAAPALAADSGGTDLAAHSRFEVNWLDLTVIAVYLVGIIALGCWAGTRRKGGEGSDYFLAGKSLSWPVIGTALFATNISTIHLVSFAQNGFTSGLTYGNYEWMAAFTLVILALFFAPFYLRAKVATLPDFMERRYSRGSRDYLAILSIFSAIVVHIGFSLLTGAIVLEGTILPSIGVADPEQYRLYTIIALCGVTAIYTIIGGLLAVVLTESVQTVVMLVGSIAITLIGLNMVGGWNEFKASVHPVNLTVLRPATDPTGVTWYAVFLGYPVLGIWYWCTDQTIVQRVLGAKDENHARIGPLFAGFIKILPVFIFVLPGIIGLGLVNRGIIDPLPLKADGTPATEHAYTHLINAILWPGMRGVVIAAMLAALMSTVSGALNSIATLVSYDIYQRWNPAADERRMVRTGRIATFVAVVVAIAWSMALGKSDATIFQAMVDMFPAVAPPTAVVFLWGVLWRRASATAALWTLVGGSLFGLAISLLKLFTGNGMIEIDPTSPLADVLAINSLFMAFLLFVAESVFLVLMSLAFPQAHTVESESLVWRSPLDALRRDEHTWRGLLDFRILSAVLVVVMIALYIGFSSRTTYYPISGAVTLNGQPVVGATLYLDAEDDLLDAALPTGADGRYAFGTVQRAGGAPAGTRYRARLVPEHDYIVRLKPDTAEVAAVLAALPVGTAVAEQSVDGRQQYAAQLPGVKPILAAPGETLALRRATEVPAPARSFETSGLTFTVTAADRAHNLELHLPDSAEPTDVSSTDGR